MVECVNHLTVIIVEAVNYVVNIPIVVDCVNYLCEKIRSEDLYLIIQSFGNGYETVFNIFSSLRGECIQKVGELVSIN